MGIEYIFLLVCAGGLLLFALALGFNTAIMGKSYCKGFQFMWSSVPKSKEADEKIKFLLNKMDANLIRASFDSGRNTIQFHELDADPKRDEPEAEIWVGNKYFSYGWLYSYGGSRNGSFIKKRPSRKSFKRILALEEKLTGSTTTNAPPSKSDSTEKVVHLE